MNHTIGKRIRRARIATGLTQEETVSALASSAGLSLTKAGLSKYERGGSTPKPSVLRGLAKVLGVKVQSFLEDPEVAVEWLAFRKKARFAKKQQEQIQVLAESYLEVFMSLQASLDPVAPSMKAPQFPVSSLEDVEIAAEKLRKRWDLGSAPIESVTKTIEGSGGVVVELPHQEGFDGLSGWANHSVPVVVLNDAMATDRKRFNLSHELGHLFMKLESDEAKVEEERFAHRFAAALLVPQDVAKKELGLRRRNLDLRELVLLKSKYGLSMQAWIFRAKDLEIIDAGHARTLFSLFSAKGWRRREPGSIEADETPTRLKQMVFRALAEGVLSRADAEAICPEVALDADELEESARRRLSPRALRALPHDERDRILTQAVETLASEYASGELADLELLSEEDHSDSSLEE